MRKLKRVAVVAFTSLALASAACERREGPMEEAGEAVDDTADEIEDRTDEIGE
jgi:hypothetical protein